jgi:hypothetical protein
MGRLSGMPAEYEAVFWPDAQPTEWRDPEFFRIEGLARPSGATSFDPEVIPAFRGTRTWPSDPDGRGSGRVVSAFFTPGVKHLLVPVMGNLGDNDVVLEREDGLRRVPASILRVGRSIELPRFARYDLSAADAERRWRLIATDADDFRDRWVAVAAPIPCGDEAELRRAVKRWRSIYRNDFMYFLRAAAITLALVGVPWWVAVAARGAWVAKFWLAAGAVVLLWTAVGLARWAGFDASARAMGIVLWWIGLGAALAGTLALFRADQARRRVAVALVFLYAVGAGLAHVQTVPDLPVLGEHEEGTVYRSRMVASPSDNIIPFCTAVYLFHHKDGRENRVVYFGYEWSLGSRGPLLPLVIAGIYAARGHEPHDPPFPTPRRWPADDEGFHIARSAAIALNGLVVLAIATLAALLVAPATAAGASVAVAALAVVSPFVTSNLVFGWPKLLAVAAVVLALAAVLSGRGRWWPVVLAAGYYAHPLAALFFPAVALLETLRAPSCTVGRKLRTFAMRAVVFLLLLAPWLAFKVWLGHPDVLWTYILGDGHGYTRASSFGSWWGCRWRSFVRTFIPFVAYAQQQPFFWFEDLVSGSALWTIYTGRTLFGQLGIGATVALLISARRLWREGRPLLVSLTAAAVLITVYWGYSDSGLGRQCLEPISAVALALVATTPVFRGRLLPYLLGMAGAEFLYVTIAGIDWAEAEVPGFLLAQELPYAAALTALAFVPALGALLWQRANGRPDR